MGANPGGKPSSSNSIFTGSQKSLLFTNAKAFNLALLGDFKKFLKG